MVHNREVLVSEKNTSDSGEEIFRRLPAWMPTTESSGNFKLLDPVGRAFDRLKEDIDGVDNATTVQNAESIEQVQKLAKLVEVTPKSNESLEKYRKRVISEFQNATSEGDIPGLFENVSTLLGLKVSQIGYFESSENGSFILSVPGDSIDNAAVTQSEFSEIITDQVAAGFRADIQSRGTFTYLTPAEYNNNEHDPSKAYDGLDSNGDPKGDGGTYAGVLN